MRESQQFIVFDSRPVTAKSPGQLHTPSGLPLTRLDADVLLLSAERIRDVFLRELGLPREESGKIRAVLYMASKPDNLIGMVSTFSPEGWDYEIDIPDQIEARRLIGGIVGGLLLELANRGQGPKSAEVPLWLLEGLSTLVAAIGGPDLIMSSVQMGRMRRSIRETPARTPGGPLVSPLDYLRAARDVLRASPPLTFAQLSHPSLDLISGDQLKLYQSSAQLFAYELLHLPNGQAKLVLMIRSLARYWNWQTALLTAYSDDFKSMLDVEKKWAVDQLAFVSHDPAQVWSKMLCLDRLDDLVTVPAQVWPNANDLPERKLLSLQQVLTNWSFSLQIPVLQQKVALLEAFRYNAAPEVVPVIQGYELTLASYLQKRSMVGRNPQNRMQPTYNPILVTRDALRDLEELDKRRKALRPGQTLSVNSPTSASR
jgi:hypothetical protein